MSVRWRAPSTDERQLAWIAFGTAVVALVVLPFAGVASRLLPPCLLRQWTGLPCPTCGATRVVLALGRMEFTEALSANPLAAIAVIGLVVAALVAPWWFLGGGKVPSARNSTLRGIAWALVVAAAVNWIYLISVGV